MNRVIAWFATNHVAANLVMGFAVLAGVAALQRIPVKLYPDFDLPVIVVTVPYLGAAPKETESDVCARIEEQLKGITGIKEIRSVSAEGLCTVEVELFLDIDRSQTLAEVENRILAIDSLPKETERPIIQLATPNNVVAEVAITAPVDERTLKELGRRVRDDILALPGITHARLANVRPYEISVEVSEESLSRYGLTFDDVAAALRERTLNLPGGSIKTTEGEILLRTKGTAQWGDELEEIVVLTRGDGTRVLVRDVAQVVDGFEDTGQALRFDGRPAALVQVSRVGDQNVRHLSEAVRNYVANAAETYPEQVELTIWRDESTTLSVRLGALLDSGVQGLLLVLILLGLFLRPHLAVWVTAGIPIAFLGAIFLIYTFGLSIDAVSVTGFILALGMLVDDAVVVGEAAYVAQRRGAGQLAGAIEGATRVLVPVTFGVITTVVAFMPLLFAVGTVGQAYAVRAATVICCLAFSLIECQLILPAHLGHGSGRLPLGDFGLMFLGVVVIAAFAIAPDMRVGGALAVVGTACVFAAHLSGHLARLGTAFARIQVRFESVLTWVIENPFRRLVDLACRRRLVTMSGAVAGIACSVALVAGGHLPFAFRAPQQGDSVTARLTMPVGTGAAVVEGAVGQLADSARHVAQRLAREHGEPVVLHILEGRGGHFAAGSRVGFVAGSSGAHLGEVTMQLTPGEKRAVSTGAVAALWRQTADPIADTVELSFLTDRIASRPEIDIRIAGSSWDDLRAVAGAVREELAAFPGVYDVADSLDTGKTELQLSVTPAGEALGISLGDLGRQVRQAFYGEEALRVQRGADDVRIMVRYTKRERGLLESLYAMHVRTPAGDEVPFTTVADARLGRGFSAIGRANGTRQAWVRAEVDATLTSAAAVLAALDAGFLDEVTSAYPSVSYSFRSAQEQSDLIAAVGPLFVFALLAVYALLAMPLRSYTQPLIIMSVLPFSLVGALWGHALMKPLGLVHGLSSPSLFGAVAASGIVINATLILIHAVNHNRAAGDTMFDALTNAAVSRFRPILITTVTTFAGLTPLMLTDSAQAQILVPMAISLAFGILISSVAALLVVPALWLVLHDVSGGAKRIGDLIGGTAGESARLAMWVARYPYVLESLRSEEFTNLEVPVDLDLDPQSATIARRGLVRLYYEREFDAAHMRAQLSTIAGKAGGTDDLVREARSWAEQRTFQLGVHMARGAIAPVDAARPLSDILLSCIGTLLPTTRREFALEHGEVPGGRVALIALGTAARREFEAGSPLQLLFLYDHDPVPPRTLVLSPDVWHAKLLERLALLLRNLSPDGLLHTPCPMYVLHAAEATPACSLEQLRAHFAGDVPAADLRMLTHARPIEATGGIGDEFDHIRRSVLSRQHDLSAIAQDIARVRGRQRVQAHDVWDVRRLRGGLDEVELTAEYLQLAGATADGGDVASLSATFDRAGRRGLLTAALVRDLINAATLWQNLEGYFRMTCAGAFDERDASTEQQRALAEFGGVDRFDQLPGVIAANARRTARHFDLLLSGGLHEAIE